MLTSDRGSQFCSSFWRRVCEILGIQHSRTTAYHPETNGLVERFHRCLKDVLQTRLVGPHWLAHLPWTMLGLCTSPRERSALSPAQYVFGTPLCLPAQFVNDKGFGEMIRRRLSARLVEQPVHNRKSMLTMEKELDCVFVRNDSAVVPPLELRYKGPFKVVSCGDGFFRL